MLLKDHTKSCTVKDILPVYNEVNTLLHAHQYIALSEVLEKIDTKRLSEVLLIGLPRLMYHCRDEIPYWYTFLINCCKELSRRGKDYRKIMKGLPV